MRKHRLLPRAPMNVTTKVEEPPATTERLAHSVNEAASRRIGKGDALLTDDALKWHRESSHLNPVALPHDEARRGTEAHLRNSDLNGMGSPPDAVAVLYPESVEKSHPSGMRLPRLRSGRAVAEATFVSAEVI